MPVVASVDYTNKLIYLTSECFLATFDTMDVYREVRALRRTTLDHRKFFPIIIGGGNIQKRPGFFTQPYVQLLFGTRLIPPDQAGEITLIRDTFDDTGSAGADVFDRSGLTSNIDIVVAVDAVEVREIATGGNDPATIAAAVWDYLSTGSLVADSFGWLARFGYRLSIGNSEHLEIGGVNRARVRDKDDNTVLYEKVATRTVDSNTGEQDITLTEPP